MHPAQASPRRKLSVRGAKTVDLGFDETGLSSSTPRNATPAPSVLQTLQE